jgi:hypothetical protein
MENHDEHFESYLGEFQPRRPQALPALEVSKAIWPRRLAAAAAIAISLGTSLWFAWRKSVPSNGELVLTNSVRISVTNPKPRPLSLLPLTELALTDPERLNAELAEMSRQELPDFQGSDSTLRALTKE